MRLQEDVLQQVFRILRPAHHAKQKAVKTSRMGAIEFLERRRIALLAAPHQIEVGRLHVA
jgi:hypothetical protein